MSEREAQWQVGLAGPSGLPLRLGQRSRKLRSETPWPAWGSALACQVATVARPPVINQFLRSCRDLFAVSPIRLDHAREQSAHSRRARFRNIGILTVGPSSIEVALNGNAQPQSEIEKCPVRPL